MYCVGVVSVSLPPAFVSLSVWLLATSPKTVDRIVIKILLEMHLVTKIKLIRLNFGSHPHPDPDLGLFEGFSTLRDRIRS